VFEKFISNWRRVQGNLRIHGNTSTVEILKNLEFFLCEIIRFFDLLKSVTRERMRCILREGPPESVFLAKSVPSLCERRSHLKGGKELVVNYYLGEIIMKLKIFINHIYIY
jgi:hypothetical protein